MRDKLKLKRVYEAPHKDDGTRILVDRLWPRGLTKEKAKVDLWLKEIAPSTELRKWFGHDVVIRVYDADGNMIETHEHKGNSKRNMPPGRNF